MHGVLDVFGFFQQALDGGDFVGDGGSWGADWDEAEVCFVRKGTFYRQLMEICLMLGIVR